MRFDDTQANFLAAAGALDGDPDLVFVLDTGTDDNASNVEKRWDSDWQAFATLGDKYLTGITIVADRNTASRIAISIAKNYITSFFMRRTFSLKGRTGTDTDATVTYMFPSPILGRVFNARLALFNDGATNQTSVRALGFHYLPVGNVPSSEIVNTSPDASPGGSQ